MIFCLGLGAIGWLVACFEFNGPFMGWSGGAMVLGELPVQGRPTIWMIVGQGPIVLAVGAGGGCFDIFTLLYLFSSLSPSLWETARYRLKYCLKGPLNPKQPTNQLTALLDHISVYIGPWLRSGNAAGLLSMPEPPAICLG